MSIDKIPASSIITQQAQGNTLNAKCHCKHCQEHQVSSDDVLSALNNPCFKPILMTTNQLTFEPNGDIIADRMNSSVQNGKFQLGQSAQVNLPKGPNQKEFYLDSLITKAKNIGCCTFLVNNNGIKKQFNIGKEKDGTISISSRNIESEKAFKIESIIPVEKSADETIKLAADDILHEYGLENLIQIAITNLK